MEANLPLQAFQEAAQLFLQTQRIVIISHRNPDADAIGANLALREALENLGKTVVSACVDPAPEDSRFLLQGREIVHHFDPANFDLFVSVDCGGHKVLGFHESMPELFAQPRKAFINIDHHASNDHFGTVNIVMPETPSTCFILYLLFGSYGWDITPNMATAMLHGLYYDTGSFMHSNTDAQTLRIAGRLKALGGKHERCVKELFHSTSIPRLRLWGRGMERAEFNEKGALVTALTQKDYQELRTEAPDASGLVTYLTHVQEAPYCILLTEDKAGQIKASMRTHKEDLDLSAIAGLFGGGGHHKAAGFTIPGHLREKRIWVVTD